MNAPHSVTASPATAGDILLMALMPLLFASNLAIGRGAVDEVGPWTLACLRWIGAVAILLPFVAASLWRSRGALLAQFWGIAVLAFLGMWACGAVVYLGLRHTTATNATLIYTSSSIFILALERIFRGRPVSLRQVVGALVAMAGVAVIALAGDLGRLLSLDLNPGDILILVAAISWAAYSVVLRRPALAALPTLPLFAAIAILGAVSLVLPMIWEAAATGMVPHTAHAWASIAGLALFPSVLAFSLYQYGVARLGPSMTGMFLYLLPPYGVLLAILFLGERLHPYHAAGLALILPGLILATAPARGASAPRAGVPIP